MSKASNREESVPAGRPLADRVIESGEEFAGTEAAAVVEPDRQVRQWLKTASEGFERTGKHLVTDLGLSAAQAGGVEEVFARREKQLESLLAGTASGETEDDGEVFGKICALIRNKGLRDDLVGVLSAEQLAAFDAREAKRERETIEARAYRDLAEINSVVRLADSQKPEVFAVLMEQAPERVEKEADARAFMSLTYGPLAADMDASVVRGLANMMNLDPTRIPGFDYGSMEYQQWIESRKAERIGNEISALQGVMEDDQLTRYREHLESQMSW